ncbi:MAG: hypothetical protein ABR598_07735 [Candidatus Dormibacteria bacterium]
MSTVTRTATVDGTFTYTLNQRPVAPPVLTIYSDPSRTVVAVAAVATVPTANPLAFTCAYPHTLPAGTYYLDLASVFSAGQPALHDADDDLVLTAPTGTVQTTVLAIDELRALVIAPDLSDDQLLSVTAREEAWLARRIGQLVGEVTQHIWVSPWDADSTLYLLRPTDSVSVVDGGAAIEPQNIRLIERGTQIEKVFGWWLGTTNRQLGPVAVTYTPNDEPEVKKALIDLVRLALPDPGVSSEQTGQYRVDRRNVDPELLAKRLMPQHGARTLTLRSSVRPDRLSSRTWTSWGPALS